MNRRRVATMVAVSVAAYCASVAVAADTTSRPAGTTTAGVYRKAPTVSCLRGKQVTIASIKPVDKRLRALRDLAQRTSWQATLRRGVVGVSIGRTANDADLLVELLRVPKDTYRLEQRANAVLLYRPSAAALAKTVRNCLS